MDLERTAAEQAALRRVATRVAEGASEAELAAAVTLELGMLFRAHSANVMRWDGDSLWVIGEWDADKGTLESPGPVFSYGGDTIAARVVEAAAPARIDSKADLLTAFGRERWEQLGFEASIGAPIEVDGKVWGVVTAARTEPGDTFPPGAEHELRDFAALVAQSIINVEARRHAAELVAEQSSLRRIATLVAGGKPSSQVVAEVTAEVGSLFRATGVMLVRWEGVQDEVVVVDSWSDEESEPTPAGTLYHPAVGSATLQVLETGFASRADELSRERGPCAAIGAPVIIRAQLLGALTATRPSDQPFPAGAEVRLRSFADLAAQSIANERAEAELRESRARIVRTADETRQRLERDLHDGAQQRLVSASLMLRVAVGKLPDAPDEARTLIEGASSELAQGLEELRDLARGLHPAILTRLGLGPALTTLAGRAPVPVTMSVAVEERLPAPVEATIYFVAAEALTNIAKHGGASRVQLSAELAGGEVTIEVADDGVGGAVIGEGTGLQGLLDRVETLGGSFGVDSPAGGGTRVWARVPV